MSLELLEADVDGAQKKWAQAVISSNVEEILQLYSSQAVLKPTLSNTIRQAPEEIKAYFVGSKKFEDKGFFNQNFTAISFERASLSLYGSLALDVGTYSFTDANGKVVSAHYTFLYEKMSDGQVLINAQHSSLFV